MSDPVQPKRYRVIDLLWYIVNFFFHREKIQKEKDQQELNNTIAKVQESYDKIDRDKQKQQLDINATPSDVKKKLDNLF